MGKWEDGKMGKWEDGKWEMGNGIGEGNIAPADLKSADNILPTDCKSVGARR
jgi:hypothetical protein